MNILELSEQEIGRRQSLQELRDMGIDTYPAAEYPTNAFSTDIKTNVEEGRWSVDEGAELQTAMAEEKVRPAGPRVSVVELPKP